MLEFVVPGLPQGKGRARASVIAGRARLYTPAKTRSFEALLREYAYGAMNGAEPMQGPLRVTVEAVFPKAASWSKKRAAAAIWHTSKPDADNLVKCLDGLNGVVWRDDAQIADARITKTYSNDGSAWLRVVIEPMGE
jgi:Holliday junction resolvase RusA-like endonuclease